MLHVSLAHSCVLVVSAKLSKSTLLKDYAVETSPWHPAVNPSGAAARDDLASFARKTTSPGPELRPKLAFLPLFRKTNPTRTFTQPIHAEAVLSFSVGFVW
jgi:hypothetical protein